MITIQTLLADKPEALAHVEGLIAKHDVWIVGGAARVLLYPFLPFPQDIDLLVNREKVPTGLFDATPTLDGSGGQGQKHDVGGVKFDEFENGLTRWLHGCPLNGDGVAIRASDGFVLMTRGFHCEPWTGPNPGYSGVMRPDYLERHVLSLQRDIDAIAAAASSDMVELVD